MTYTDDDVTADLARMQAVWDEFSGVEVTDANTRRLNKALLDAVTPAIAARELREAADDLDTFAAETYGEGTFPLLSTDEYRALDSDLRTRFAAGCYRHAIRTQAKRLRERAEQVNP